MFLAVCNIGDQKCSASLYILQKKIQVSVGKNLEAILIGVLNDNGLHSVYLFISIQNMYVLIYIHIYIYGIRLKLLSSINNTVI